MPLTQPTSDKVRGDYPTKMQALRAARLPYKERAFSAAEPADLESKADYILYTVGVGDGGAKQETPAHMLELARKNPDKTVELIHFDHAFNQIILHEGQYKQYYREMTPHCLHSDDWNLLLPVDSRVHRFQHKSYPNLSVALNNSPIKSLQQEKLKKVIHDQLARGAEVFLGSHNQCFEAIEDLGAVYNELRQEFPGKIHLYVQCADVQAFVYTGPYNDRMARFIAKMNFDQSMGLGRGFSLLTDSYNGQPFTPEIVEKLRKLMDDFVNAGAFPEPNKVRQELYSFLKPGHGLKMIPSEQLQLSHFNAKQPMKALFFVECLAAIALSSAILAVGILFLPSGVGIALTVIGASGLAVTAGLIAHSIFAKKSPEPIAAAPGIVAPAVLAG